MRRTLDGIRYRKCESGSLGKPTDKALIYAEISTNKKHGPEYAYVEITISDPYKGATIHTEYPIDPSKLSRKKDEYIQNKHIVVNFGNTRLAKLVSAAWHYEDLYRMNRATVSG